MSNELNIEKNLKEAILTFSKVDHKNNFSFTSGHLGAVLIQDYTLRNLIHQSSWIWCALRFFYFLYEFCKFILNALIPIKNVGVIVRTLLRFLCNAHYQLKSHKLVIISLGDSCAGKDAYFAPLLGVLQNKYYYFKIVGGSRFLTKNYIFIECLLTRLDLFKFSLYVFISPIIDFVYLVRGAYYINDKKLAITYLILGLGEISRGIVVQNQLISQSIKSLLDSRAYDFKKVVYPMEGRNWEKKIVKLINASCLTSIGYVHSMLTPRHLSLINEGFYRDKELPFTIFTPGEMIFNIVKKSFKNVLVKNGFFLRGSGVQSTEKFKISPNRLLFALTGDQRQSKKIITLIANSNFHKKYDVIIRLNKNTSTYFNLFTYAKSLGLNLYSDLEPNNSLPAICFFRSSSVALDYLKYNCIPIYLRFNDEVSSSCFELDNKINCQAVSIGADFDFEIESLLSKNTFIENNKVGKEISDYYLNQSYKESDLLQLF